jgi:hypothetical protein
MKNSQLKFLLASMKKPTCTNLKILFSVTLFWKPKVYGFDPDYAFRKLLWSWKWFRKLWYAHTGENRLIKAKQRQKSTNGKKKAETEILMQLSEQYLE